MIKTILRSVSCCLSLILLVGCFGLDESEELKKDDQETEDSTGLNFNVDAVLNPDSTVQIYISDVPFLYFWEVKRNGVIQDTLWNQLWIDTLRGSETTLYNLTLFNVVGDTVAERVVTAKKFGDIPKVGITFPNAKTKEVIGSTQRVYWTPESFLCDSVQIYVAHIGNNKEVTKSIIVPNEGSASFTLNRNYYYDYIKIKSTIYAYYKIFPKGSDPNGVYAYRSDYIRVLLPSYSKKITYPSLGDTLAVGTISYITWDKTEIVNESDNLEIVLLDSELNEVYNFGYLENSGEYVWSVPNLGSGLYYIKLFHKTNGDYITQIGFPFYIQR